MQVNNSVYPNQAQLQGFTEPGPEGPIYMVNLLKFKEKAEYLAGQLNIETADAGGSWLGESPF